MSERDSKRRTERAGPAPAERLALFEAALDCSTQSVSIVDAEGRLVYANQAARQITKAELDFSRPLLGQVDIRDTSGRSLLPEQRPLARALRGEEANDVELRVARPDGTEALIWMTTRAVRGHQGNVIGVVALTSDITARARVEAERARLATNLQLLLDSTDQGIYGIDLGARCTFVNRAAAEQLGYRPEEMLGQNLHELVHHSRADGSPYPEAECRVLNAMRNGKGCRLDDEVLWRRDGKAFPTEYSSFPIVENGKVTGAVITFLDITARKEAEQARLTLAKETERRIEAEAARKVLERYRLLSENARDMMIFSGPNDEIVEANRAALQAYGWSAEELVSMKVIQLHAVGAQHCCPPSRPRSPGETFETMHRRKDGGLFPVEVTTQTQPISGQPVTLSIVRDITERKRSLEELTERTRLAALSAEATLAVIEEKSLGDMLQRCARALVSHLDAALARIWTLDHAPGLLELQASAGMYTHLDGAHSRIKLGQLKIGRIAEARRPHLTNSVVGDPHVPDQEWAKREKLVSFAGYPLLLGDKVLGVVAIFSRQRLTEATLQCMASVANAVSIGISHRRAERLREEYLSLISHDLRAPLMVVLSQAEALKLMGAVRHDEVGARSLAAIYANGKRISSMITELEESARLESGLIQLRDEPFSLRSVVEDTLVKALPAGDRERVQLRSCSDALTVRGDAERMVRVLVNLLSNALKYSPADQPVTVGVGRSGGEALVSVADRGDGVDPADLPRVFERFYRGASAGSLDGLGLGLYISRLIVEAHGGRIWAESRPGEGSTFSFALPLLS